MSNDVKARLVKAAESARSQAQAFPGSALKDALPWAVIDAYDRTVRGSIARDPRIEDERDRVLIAAVRLAETPPEDTDEIGEARNQLIAAIDGLEEAARRFGGIGREEA